MKRKTYIYRRFERFWHWNQALLILFLALTGFEIHSSYSLFGYQRAVVMHNVAAWALLVLIVFAIFWHFVTGEWKQYIPTTKYIKAQVEYYITGIFKGAPHPTNKTVYDKFNPLQRLIYLGLKLFVIPVQVATGFIYLFYIYPDNPAHSFDLTNVATIHTLGAFMLLSFVIAHVYLTTTGETPFSSIKAMITGWEVVDVDENEERIKHLHKAVEDSVAGYYRLDKEGKITDVNDAWLKMYRCKDKNNIIGKHFSVTRDEKHIADLENLVKRVLSGETITGMPVVRKCFDGSTGKHILSANPVVENGEIAGVEGFVLDIDEKEGLSDHVYYTVRNSAAGYYRLDEKGNLADVNDAWLKYYKYDSKDEVLGKHFSVTREGEELKKLQDIFDKVMSGETVTGVISERKCKDGTTGRHILSANPITVGNKIVGMEGFILDITELESDM
ncbi:MAG: PAS domain S-box protein [Chlorobi bacterium]|nr:PAS domain S-box protein [Chlorobiota bacterium]